MYLSRTLTGVRGSLHQAKTLANAISVRRTSANADEQVEDATTYNFETLKVDSPHEYVYHVELNRPKKMNAFNKVLWREIRECFIKLNDDTQCRSIVLSGAGKVFTAGIDLTDLGDMASLVSGPDDIARKASALRKTVKSYQDSFTVIDKCAKPVIAAIHNGCIGAGVDLISACDIRYCTSDTWFNIKEVLMGLAADVGTLQRLPKIVGNDSIIRELAYTSRNFYADEAMQIGLIGRVFPSKTELMSSAMEVAKSIASKSPVAVQGTKMHMNYARDHTIDDSLDYIANWNMTMLMSEDLMKSAMAAMDKSGTPPQFSKL